MSWGMGDTTTCPSAEQLQGIVDLNDPCQSGFSSLPLATTGPLSAAGVIIDPTTGAIATNLPPTSSATTSNMTPWIIGGVAVLALVLILGVRR